MKDDCILLVEDNPDEVLLIMRALKKSGIKNEVLVARDGAEALDLLLGAGTLPTLVLLDMRLPRLDGPEVLGRLREHDRTRHLPVVLLTAHEGEREALAQVDRPGTYCCLPKDVDFERFSREVRRIVSQLVGTDLASDR